MIGYGGPPSWTSYPVAKVVVVAVQVSVTFGCSVPAHPPTAPTPVGAASDVVVKVAVAVAESRYDASAGLAVTMVLYALLLAYTPLDYLVARVIVSVFAGLVVFVLNAVLNFRRV